LANKIQLKMFRFTAEELKKLDVGDATFDGVKCGCCNWRVSRLFVLAQTEKEALEIIKEYGGLCGECMSDMLVEDADKHEIYYIPKEESQ